MKLFIQKKFVACSKLNQKKNKKEKKKKVMQDMSDKI